MSRVLAGDFGPQNEEAFGLGRALAALGEFPSLVLHFEYDLVIAGFPRRGQFELKGARPIAAVGGGVLGNLVDGAVEIAFGEHDFALGADASDFEGELGGGGGDVQRQALARLIADLAGVALDEQAFLIVRPSRCREGQKNRRRQRDRSDHERTSCRRMDALNRLSGGAGIASDRRLGLSSSRKNSGRSRLPRLSYRLPLNPGGPKPGGPNPGPKPGCGPFLPHVSNCLCRLGLENSGDL